MRSLHRAAWVLGGALLAGCSVTEPLRSPTVCQPGARVEAELTATSNRRCAACPPGTYTAEENAPECHPWSSCPIGFYVQRPGSAAADRLCAPCKDGTFTTSANTPQCEPSSSVGGEVQGLLGADLVLRLTHEKLPDQNLTISSDGAFTFEWPVPNGSTVHLDIVSQPTSPSQGCVVSVPSHVVNGPLTDLRVDCLPLRAVSSLSAVHLSWEGVRGEVLQHTVALLYSTASDCQWEEVYACENGGAISDLTVDDLALSDGFDDRGWYFVAEITAPQGVLRSNQVGGRPTRPAPDREVSALEVTDDALYVGGHFGRVGPYTGGGAALWLDSGSPTTALPRVEGTVYAVQPDGWGGWYIGGDFLRVGGLERSRLAHVHSDGSVNPNFRPSMNDTVRALVIHGDHLYVGGDFTQVGANHRSHLASFNLQNGTLSSFRPSLDGSVYALAVRSDTLYAGGTFITAEGEARPGLVALRALSSSSGAELLSWNPSPNGIVHTLAIADGTSPNPAEGIIYVGGDFTVIAGASRRRLAALHLHTGEASSWDPGANATVRVIAVSDHGIYAGGDFTEAGGAARSRLARFRRDQGTLSTWAPGVNQSVYALDVFRDWVVVGGIFSEVDGVPRQGLVALDSTTGDPSPFDPSPNGLVRAVVAETLGGSPLGDGVVYAGGAFDSIGGQPQPFLAAFDPATGRLRTWNLEADGAVHAMAVADTTLYLGGQFSTLGGKSRPSLAAIDVTTGEVLDWSPSTDGTVYSLAVEPGGPIYAGGLFTTAGGLSRENLAAFADDGSVVAGWNPGANSVVWALVAAGGTVYAGGLFTEAGGEPRQRIAGFEGASGELVAGWNAETNGAVRAMVVSSSMLYAGGLFTESHGTPRPYAAGFHRSDGSAYTWTHAPNDWVYTLVQMPYIGGVPYSLRIYTGGRFSMVSTRERASLAAYNLNGTLLSDWNPGAIGPVYALALSPTMVFAGGAFTAAGGDIQPRLAAFHPATGARLW